MIRLKSVYNWWTGLVNRKHYEHYLQLARQGGFESEFRFAYVRGGGHRHFHCQSPSQIQAAFNACIPRITKLPTTGGYMAESNQSTFDREQRYLVMKSSDVIAAGLTETELDQLQAICAKVDQYRTNAGKPNLESLVIEKDWPEYEPTWKAIEQRVITG